jgi:hypothetical protein
MSHWARARILELMLRTALAGKEAQMQQHAKGWSQIR